MILKSGTLGVRIRWIETYEVLINNSSLPTTSSSITLNQSSPATPQIESTFHEVECVYLKKDHIPELLLAYKAQDYSRPTNPTSGFTTVYETMYVIKLKNDLSLEFENNDIAAAFLEILNSDFEGKNLKELKPELFL